MRVKPKQASADSSALQPTPLTPWLRHGPSSFSIWPLTSSLQPSLPGFCCLLSSATFSFSAFVPRPLATASCAAPARPGSAFHLGNFPRVWHRLGATVALSSSKRGVHKLPYIGGECAHHSIAPQCAANNRSWRTLQRRS